MGSSHELPARANLEHLRNEAKQLLRELRASDAVARLSDAQLIVAREYGFPSWRRLKAAVDDRERDRVFAAARDGDLHAVRRALERGFNPGASDANDRSLHQLAKSLGHTELETMTSRSGCWRRTRRGSVPTVGTRLRCICWSRSETLTACGGSSSMAST